MHCLQMTSQGVIRVGLLMACKTEPLFFFGAFICNELELNFSLVKNVMACPLVLPKIH